MVKKTSASSSKSAEAQHTSLRAIEARCLHVFATSDSSSPHATATARCKNQSRAKVFHACGTVAPEPKSERAAAALFLWCPAQFNWQHLSALCAPFEWPLKSSGGSFSAISMHLAHAGLPVRTNKSSKKRKSDNKFSCDRGLEAIARKSLTGLHFSWEFKAKLRRART